MSLPPSVQKKYEAYLKRHNTYSPFQKPISAAEFHEEHKKKNAAAVARSLKQAGPLVNAYRCWKAQNPEQNIMEFAEWKEWRETLPKDSLGRKYAMHKRPNSLYNLWNLHKFYLIANLGNPELTLQEISNKTKLSTSVLSEARTLEELPYGLGRLKKHKK